MRARYALVLLFFMHSGYAFQTGAEFELVIRNGRVMNPETNFDAVANVGIRNGVIEAVSIFSAIRPPNHGVAPYVFASPGVGITHRQIRTLLLS